MSLLTRAGGVSGVLRRFLRQPRQTLTAVSRLVSSRLNASRLERLEEPYATAFYAAALPKQEALASAFSDLRGIQVRGRNVTSGEIVTRQGLHIWSLINEHHLSTVVETGVCNGLSSHLILSALQASELSTFELSTSEISTFEISTFEQSTSEPPTCEKGKLISIDLPEFSDETGSDVVWEGKGGAVVPAGKAVGWLVDEALKSRWDLKLGTSRDLLPACLEELGSIDLFIHDSEHSFENQLFEFTIAFGSLRVGGYLVLSDIQWSRAYSQFWRKIRDNAECYFLDHSCAVVRKTG